MLYQGVRGGAGWCANLRSAPFAGPKGRTPGRTATRARAPYGDCGVIRLSQPNRDRCSGNDDTILGSKPALHVAAVGDGVIQEPVVGIAGGRLQPRTAIRSVSLNGSSRRESGCSPQSENELSTSPQECFT